MAGVWLDGRLGFPVAERVGTLFSPALIPVCEMNLIKPVAMDNQRLRASPLTTPAGYETLLVKLHITVIINAIYSWCR